MGIRKPGELDSAVAKLRKDLHEYDTADYPEDNSAYTVAVDQKAVRVVLDAVQAEAEEAFVLRMLVEAGQHPANLTVLARGVLHGLKAMGWSGPGIPEGRLLADQQHLVLETLTKMQGLPWSGDHLYGDALYDAVTILEHVLAGKDGWPVLERFRCPSTAIDRGAVARCELQLPHDGMHKVTDPLRKWKDNEATNPPKPVDFDAEELSGHPVRRCSFKYLTGGTSVECGLNAGHGPDHVSDDGTVKWVNDYQEPVASSAPIGDGQCPEYFNAQENRGRCTMHRGHTGAAHYDATSGASWPVS